MGNAVRPNGKAVRTCCCTLLHESLKKFFAGLKSDEDKTLLDVWQFDDEVKHLADSVDASNVESPQVLRNGCLIRTRTLTSRFRICGATITP